MKWSVWGKVSATKFIGVYEAETEAEAISVAMEKNGWVSVCHQCAREVEDPEIHECIVELDV
jgi:rRNA maturation endonuclease Nob1